MSRVEMNDNEPAADPVVDFLVADKFFGRIDPPRTPECPPDGVLFDWEMGQPIDPAVRAHVESGCVFCAAKRAVFGGWLGTRSLPRTGDDLPLLRRFAKPTPAVSTPQPAPDYASLQLTNLARSKNPADREQLRARLRLWLPALFPDLELNEQQTAAFLQTLAVRPALQGDQRFRDVLPDWLAEFLKRPVGSMVINRATVGRAAVLRTVGATKEAESELAKKVRAFVLEKQPRDPDDLERLDFPADIRANPAFEPYTDNLFAETRREWHEGLNLFELLAA